MRGYENGNERRSNRLIVVAVFVVLVGLVAFLFITATSSGSSGVAGGSSTESTLGFANGSGDVETNEVPGSTPTLTTGDGQPQQQEKTSSESATTSQQAENPARTTQPTEDEVSELAVMSNPEESNPEEVSSSSGDAELDGMLESIVNNYIGTGEDALRNAYEYVAANYLYTKQNEYPDGDWTVWSIPYAKEMYSNGMGNCYRFSSLFCWIARYLGYDAVVVQGMVPMSEGLSAHGWVEIHEDGDTFVCDPDLHKYMPDIDLFMVTYDDSRLAYYHLDGTEYTNEG